MFGSKEFVGFRSGVITGATSRVVQYPTSVGGKKFVVLETLGIFL